MSIVSPWVIAVEFAVIMVGILILGRIQCSDYMRGFFIMAAMVFMFYVYIAVFEPSIQFSRDLVRTLLLLEGGGALSLIVRKFKENSRHER